MDALKMLIVVTGTDMYADGNLQTGLWLSELTHIYHCAEEAGYEITVASPKGGNVPVDPESLKPMMLDKLSKDYWDDLGHCTFQLSKKSFNGIHPSILNWSCKSSLTWQMNG